MMYSETAKREAVRNAYEAYYKDHALVKNKDTQFYKRWMRNGDIPAPSMTARYQQERMKSANRMTGAWEEMGPWSYDPEVAMQFQVQSPGACHVYTIEQSQSNHTVVWAGTATAGAWKSEDHGEHWELMTRNLPLTSVYSIAIHPENEDHVFVGSGSGQLWHSADGGVNWSICGDDSFQSVNRWYRDVIWSPIDSEGNYQVLAATDQGLWAISEWGETATSIAEGEFMELAFHPSNSSICYAIQRLEDSTVFKRSMDGGMSFSTGAIGWPTVGSDDAQRRCEMAVTAADPNRVVVLASGSTAEGGGLYGHYVSYDAGLSFEFTCCGEGPGGPWEAGENPNILGWSEDGAGDGGQFYYDLALDVSPTDADRQFAAGICVWRTLDGGQDWTLNAHWVTWAGEFTAERYTHADVHDVKFFTRLDGTVDLWVASDGGLHYSADQGDHFEPRMYGIQGTDFWGWQAGWRGPDVMVGGTYHNGTLIRNGDLYHYGADNDSTGGWLAELAGDNFRGFINPGDPTIGYYDGGSFRFSEERFDRIDALPFDVSKNPNTGYWFGEVGNMEWDPRCYQCLYSPVGSELWRSEDGGVSFSLVHDFGGDKIISVKVSPRDPQRIYVSHKQGNAIWSIQKSSDGGETWSLASLSSIESGVSNSDEPIYLDVDGTNPDRAWCILTGSHFGYKVFETLDAGQTWQNLTTETIQNERVISIAHQRGSDGGLYIGTTQAVYYRDDTMEDWILYNNGLPAINVSTFLQPDYCGGHIRTAGTRGVHQADFYNPSDVLAGFMASTTSVNLASSCDVPPIRFVDVSVARCDGTTYDWVFEGGSPLVASGEEVWVDYDEVGQFDVSLTVTDSTGTTDTWTWESMIDVVNESVLPAGGFIEDFDGEQFPPANWRMETPGHAWEHAWELTDETNGVAQFPNYWVDTQGEKDLLITPAFDPTGMTGMAFNLAYRTYADYMDGLEIWGKAGGDDDWTVLWSAYGSELSVADCYTWFWYDSEGTIAWANHEVAFPDYWQEGTTCLELAFVNVGGNGNHTWIDQVVVGSPVGVSETHPSEWRLFPNPNEGTFMTEIPSEKVGSNYVLTDQVGRMVQFGTIAKNQKIWQLSVPAGWYVLEIHGLAPKKIVIH